MQKWTEKAFDRVEQDFYAGLPRGAILNRLRVFFRLNTNRWDSVRSAFRRAKKVLHQMKVEAPEGISAEMVDKAKRRAKRHFNGEKVTHRVVSKSDTHLTLRFNRSSDRVEITVRKV